MIKVEDGKGNLLIERQIKNTPKLTREGIRSAMYESGKDLVDTARALINSKNKSGRLYRVQVGFGGQRLKKSRLHRASAVGEAPAALGLPSCWLPRQLGGLAVRGRTAPGRRRGLSGPYGS